MRNKNKQQTNIGTIMTKSSTKNKKNTPTVPDEMDNQEIHFKMEMIKGNPNGGADFVVDANEYTFSKLVEIGVITLLKEHIEQEKAKKKKWWQLWK